MSSRVFAGFLCLLAVLCLVPDGPAHGQKPQRPYATLLADWGESLDRITQELSAPDLATARAEAIQDHLATIEAEARAARVNAEAALKPLRDQLGALGPPPEEGRAPEAEEIEAQRRTLETDIADYEGRVKQADLTLARIKELRELIAARTLERSLERLFRSYPVPLAPVTIAVAVPDFLAALAALARSPLDWGRSLSAAQRELVLIRLAVIVVPALLIGWLLRRALLRFFGRDPEVRSPSYARRLTGAVADGLARGIIPSLILGGFLYRALSETSVISGLFGDVVAAFCGVAIMFTLAWALPRAVLAPDLPAWRLLPVSPDHARAISRRIAFLAGVFAIDLFLAFSSQGLVFSDELISLYTLVTKALEAGAILVLIRGDLWAWQEEPEAPAPDAPAPAPDASEPGGAPGGWNTWVAVRRIIGIAAIAGVLTVLAGYANLGRYVIENLVISGMVVGVVFLVRGLGRELIGAAMRSALVQVNLGIPHKARSRYKFWLRALLDLTVYFGGLVLVLVVWGVPAQDILNWAGGALRGFRIGNVTISLTDIFIAVIVFLAVMTITRATQRLLTERVFPQTDLDSGVRHSLSAGLGYIGLALAAMLAIAAIGLDLSNIALIAGALSVGIGFGLQTVVNNFVSGLILLIERPIKVGDWIVVGGHEGTVKRINVRATEIETFQRASVIVPNSELVAGAVTNWTHKDRYGRVEIPIGVAYGSDVERVMATLKGCLDASEDILPWPEPYVLFRGFGESSLDFEARGFIGNVERRIRVTSELCIAIDAAFRKEGIEIPFPQRDLHVRSAEGLDRALRAGRPGQDG